MFNFLNQSNKLYAPVNGQLMPIAKVPDKMFASKSMGDGFAVQPSDGQIVSPVDGKITMVAGAKHALGLKAKDGTEYLIHMGIDTVALDGAGFDILTAVGKKVHHGQPIATFDLPTAEAAGKATVVVVVVLQKEDVIPALREKAVHADDLVADLDTESQAG